MEKNSVLSVEQKKSYIKMLMEVSKVDGEIHVNEERFINDIARQIGLSFEDVIDINLYPEKIKTQLPSNEKERMTILYHLLFMMRFDGIVKENEIEIVKKLGFKLGINPFLTDELIEIMIRFAIQDIPENIMLETLVKYMN
ncbi:MAG: TerB family tellurite resistance protein [Saprospiraceae bacterium]|nr:TerB family tellurite resistance protein [Saprospiraceae bacterium]